MSSIILYVGPGLGIGTIIIVLVVLLIILCSIGIILWTPIKRFLKKIRSTGRPSQE